MRLTHEHGPGIYTEIIGGGILNPAIEMSR